MYSLGFGFRLVAMSNSLILSMELMKKKLPISSKPSSLWNNLKLKNELCLHSLVKDWGTCMIITFERVEERLFGRPCKVSSHPLAASLIPPCPQKWKKSLSVKYPNWASMPLGATSMDYAFVYLSDAQLFPKLTNGH